RPAPLVAELLVEREHRRLARLDRGAERAEPAGARELNRGDLQRGADAAPPPVGDDAGRAMPELPGRGVARVDAAQPDVASVLDGDEEPVAGDAGPVEPESRLALVERRQPHRIVGDETTELVELLEASRVARALGDERRQSDAGRRRRRGGRGLFEIEAQVPHAADLDEAAGGEESAKILARRVRPDRHGDGAGLAQVGEEALEENVADAIAQPGRIGDQHQLPARPVDALLDAAVAEDLATGGVLDDVLASGPRRVPLAQPVLAAVMEERERADRHPVAVLRRAQPAGDPALERLVARRATGMEAPLQRLERAGLHPPARGKQALSHRGRRQLEERGDLGLAVAAEIVEGGHRALALRA